MMSWILFFGQEINKSLLESVRILSGKVSDEEPSVGSSKEDDLIRVQMWKLLIEQQKFTLKIDPNLTPYAKVV